MKIPKAIALALFASLTFAFAGDSNWMTDLEAAKVKAKKENKAILVDFTGSDWCHWCKILDKEVFSHQSFLKEAQKNFILVEIDLPRKTKIDPSLKARNKALVKKYQIKGYPTVLLMDHDGKVFKKTGYQKGGPKAYLASIQSSLKAKDFK